MLKNIGINSFYEYNVVSSNIFVCVMYLKTSVAVKYATKIVYYFLLLLLFVVYVKQTINLYSLNFKPQKSKSIERDQSQVNWHYLKSVKCLLETGMDLTIPHLFSTFHVAKWHFSSWRLIFFSLIKRLLAKTYGFIEQILIFTNFYHLI